MSDTTRTPPPPEVAALLRRAGEDVRRAVTIIGEEDPSSSWYALAYRLLGSLATGRDMVRTRLFMLRLLEGRTEARDSEPLPGGEPMVRS